MPKQTPPPGPEPLAVDKLPNLQMRAKAVKAHSLRAKGLSIRDIAKEVGAAPSTVSNWIKLAEAQPAQFFPPAWRDKLQLQLEQLEQFQLDASDYDIEDPQSVKLLNEVAQAFLQTHREIRLTLAALNRMVKQGPGYSLEPQRPDRDAEARIGAIVVRMTPSLAPDDPFWDYDA